MSDDKSIAWPPCPEKCPKCRRDIIPLSPQISAFRCVCGWRWWRASEDVASAMSLLLDEIVSLQYNLGLAVKQIRAICQVVVGHARDCESCDQDCARWQKMVEKEIK